MSAYGYKLALTINDCFSDYLIHEIQHVPLESLVLQAAALGLGNIRKNRSLNSNKKNNLSSKYSMMSCINLEIYSIKQVDVPSFFQCFYDFFINLYISIVFWLLSLLAKLSERYLA